MAPAHPPLNTDLFGVVKAVPTGDSLVLLKPGPAAAGPPPEIRVYLASVRAPALAHAAAPAPAAADGGAAAAAATAATAAAPVGVVGAQQDEPGAFAARERLRTALIGRRVRFVLEYTVPALNNRLMAAVFVAAAAPAHSAAGQAAPATAAAQPPRAFADGENVAVVLAREGLVRVRRPGDPAEARSKFYDTLCDAEDAAVREKIGLHAPDLSVLPRRNLSTAALDPNALASDCKGIQLKGICEYVINGSALKVLVRNIPGSLSADGTGPGDGILTLCFSGVQCPGFRRAEGEDVAKPMPFALNAKFLTEARLLHRDVVVSIEGADRNGMLFATITDPAASLYVGEELLRAGFAKTVSWSIELSARAPALRAAERIARDAQVGVWAGFVKPKSTSEKSFVARCVEVVSGDMIAVLDESSGEPRRISLASVRAARAEPGRDRSVLILGPAADAKEALRKKLIGRMVNVHIEYTREPAETSLRKDRMVFATVGREGDAKNTDVALPMITDGLLSVVRHRGEEDRSPNYELYLEREAAAKEAQRGIHKATDKPSSLGSDAIRINNLTGPDAKKRSRDVLPGLQRANPHVGVIDYVSSGSRMRIYLPKQAMLITLGLKAVRTPQPSRKSYLPDGTARLESASEPHGDEALAYARENFMQRDVEVEVSGVDRMGAFLGNVVIVSTRGERQDVSKMLITSGVGYIHESFDSREAGGSALVAAEKSAREGKIGLWVDYKEPEIEEGVKAMRIEPGNPPEAMVGMVSEIGFGGRLFVQTNEKSKFIISAVEAGLKSLNLDDTAAIPVASLKAGEIVAAKFSADGLWYRAKILTKSGTGARVRFIDYGNEETVAAADIRRPSGAIGFMSSPPAAIEIVLADIVVPEAHDNFGLEAGEFIRDLVYGKTVEVIVNATEGTSKVIGDVRIVDEADSNGTEVNGTPSSSSVAAATATSGSPKSTSLTEKLLESGIVRIVRKSDRVSRVAFSRLAEFEKIGQATRDFLWTYGDAYESDCDDEDEVKDRNRVRRGGR